MKLGCSGGKPGGLWEGMDIQFKSEGAGRVQVGQDRVEVWGAQLGVRPWGAGERGALPQPLQDGPGALLAAGGVSCGVCRENSTETPRARPCLPHACECACAGVCEST